MSNLLLYQHSQFEFKRPEESGNSITEVFIKCILQSFDKNLCPNSCSKCKDKNAAMLKNKKYNFLEHFALA